MISETLSCSLVSARSSPQDRRDTSWDACEAQWKKALEGELGEASQCQSVQTFLSTDDDSTERVANSGAIARPDVWMPHRVALMRSDISGKEWGTQDSLPLSPLLSTPARQNPLTPLIDKITMSVTPVTGGSCLQVEDAQTSVSRNILSWLQNDYGGTPFPKENFSVFVDQNRVTCWIRDTAATETDKQKLAERLAAYLKQNGLQLARLNWNGTPVLSASPDPKGGE